MASTSTQGPAETGSAHLREAQSAMRALLEDVGLAEARASEVGRTLGLDKSLASKIARFVKDEDPSSAARLMPGSGGVDIVIRAAEARGVAEGHVEAVRRADRALRAFVEKHAGDRRTFEAMFATGPSGGLDLEVRRDLYRSASAAWGVRARTQFLTLAARPSETRPGKLDFVKVGGFVEFERLRPDVPWIISRFHTQDDHGAERYEVEREPLEPGREGGMPFMTRHCSHPVPEINRFERGGVVYDELAPGPIGRRGAVTVVTGERYLGPVSHERSPGNEWGVYPLLVRTPIEGLQFDLLLHPDLSHFGPARLARRGLLEDRPHSGRGYAEWDTEGAPSLRAPFATSAGRVPRYSELLSEAFERAGWDGLDGYRGYRAEVAYPLAPSEVTLMCEIGGV